MLFFDTVDIPFKGSQSLSNIRSKVTTVSYLHRGVIHTTVHVTAVLLIPLCHVHCAAKSDFRVKKVFCIVREDIRSFIRKGFNLCVYQGSGEVV
jgi:hypothetical protein